MKKILLGISVLVAVLLVAVSCNMESKVEDGVGILSFQVSEAQAKSLTRTNPELNVDQFYWFYTALKTDGTGLTVGQTTAQVAVDAGKKGIPSAVGTFSYGDWTFTLYGYADLNSDNSGKDLAYSGSANLTIKASSGNKLNVTVESKQSADGKGYLEFPAKGNIALTGKGMDSSNVVFANLVEKISFKRVDSSAATIDPLYNYAGAVQPGEEGKEGVAGVEPNGLRRLELPSGSYSVTFEYLQGGAWNSANTAYEGGYAVAQETIYVAIADYLVTTIGGDITGNTGTVEITVQNGIVEVKVADVEIKKDEATKIEVAAAPVSETATGEGTGSVTETPKTEISIPVGAISGTKVSATTTSYSREAVASSKPTIVIKASSSGSEAGGDGTSQGGSQGETEPAEEEVTAVVLGGLDINLYVDDSTEKATDFSGDKALTITTYVSKGLNGGVAYDSTTAAEGTKCDIQVIYDGPLGEDGQAKSNGKVVSYDPETGMLVFSVDHLSTYYFVSVNAVVANSRTQVVYEDLASAIAAANSGDTLTLMKDVKLSETIGIDKSLNLDLGGKAISASCRAFYIHKGTVTIANGTVKTSVENNPGTSVIRVSCDSKCKEHVKGETLGLIIKSDATIIGDGCYCISSFGKNDAVLDIYGELSTNHVESSCLGGNGHSSFTGKLTMNVYDGAKLTSEGTAIYQPNNGILNIYGGTISGKNSAVEVRAGEVNIYGGTLTVTGEAYSVTANDNGYTTKGAALAVAQHTTKLPITVTLYGGELKCGDGAGSSVESEAKQLVVVNPQNNGEADIAKVKVLVKDGVSIDNFVGYKTAYGNFYFDKQSAFINDEAVAKVGDTYYVEFQDAVDSVKTAESKSITVEVLRNEVILASVPASSEYTITFVGKGKDKTVIHVRSDANNYESNGAIYCEGTALKFKDVTVDFGSAANYQGFIRASELAFESCNISGMGSHWGTGDVTFKNCVFMDYNEGKDSAVEGSGFNQWSYNMWLYSGLNFVFEDCQFYSSNGKFINVYIEQVQGDIKVSLTRCSFIAGKNTGDGEVEKKTALKVMKAGNWDISFTDCTADEYVKIGTRTGSRLYNVLEEDVSKGTTVTIDGDVVWKDGGRILTMGKIPSSVKTYGGQDITWKVLEVKEDKMLVLSEKVLFNMKHYETAGMHDWDNSLIKAYLNNEGSEGFVSQYGLEDVEIVAASEDESGYGAGDVFLLSSYEVQIKYFNDSFTSATAYNLADTAIDWWTRSAGEQYEEYPSYDFVVNYDNGYFDSDGEYATNEYGVRPAFWISTN